MDVAVGIIDVKSYYIETPEDIAERVELCLKHAPADRLSFAPIAIPAVAMGVAFLWLYLSVPIPVYGTIWILLIAYVAKHLAFAVRPVTTAVQQTSAQISLHIVEIRIADGEGDDRFVDHVDRGDDRGEHHLEDGEVVTRQERQLVIGAGFPHQIVEHDLAAGLREPCEQRQRKTQLANAGARVQHLAQPIHVVGPERRARHGVRFEACGEHLRRDVGTVGHRGGERRRCARGQYLGHRSGPA